MLSGKKVIALCTTKMHTPSHLEFCHRLSRMAQRRGCKLLILNTFVDFFNHNEQDEGAASVYRAMNLSVIDAVVILADAFCDPAVPEGIIARAKEQGVPVILVKGQAEGCWSVQPDYHDAYCALLNHVIRTHEVRDVFYLAGKRGDEESEKRIACFREVLAENGIPFVPEMVAYGDYWNEPARRCVRGLLAKSARPPRAIFCANDSMAFGVCTELQLQGYHIPRDVIVTGFDGVPAIDSFSPRLTTCWEDIGALVSASIKAALAAIGGEAPRTLTYPHEPRFSESCGCAAHAPMDDRAAFRLHTALDSMQSHEDFIYSCIDRMQGITDMKKLYKSLSLCIIGNSHVCLNSSFVADALEATRKEDEPFSGEMTVISSSYHPTHGDRPGRMSLADMVPHLDEWLKEDTCCVITPVHAGKLACGYYAICTDDLPGNADKIKRISSAVNIAMSSAVNHFRQANMNLRIRRAATTNPVTGLPNLKGAVDWFEGFAAKENNHYKSLTVSVYSLPKYSYIVENYGIEAGEEALRVTAEALRLANPLRCFIAHVTEDSFAIIHHYIDGNDIGDTINNATAVFYSMIEGYNSRSGLEYYVEVNCGCTVVSGGWSGTLESYLRAANEELFRNRLKAGQGVADKAASEPNTYYAAFRMLMDKNMFHYHFQPIVSAKDGTVLAYEALMRTDRRIGMSPPQVLEAARQYNRLYDVEKYTLFNILERFAAERESFGDRKLFINTIPGYFLRKEDADKLFARYGEHLGRVVFELTEENTVSSEELETIRSLCVQGCGSILALDDYGVGHSNIVNLMRYAPQIIKIDHYLISNIHNDTNKQLFVRSTIDFARHNGMTVLAEGVETYKELRTLIEMGVDLIQGFYTGRPVLDPVSEIAADVRQEILDINAGLA